MNFAIDEEDYDTYLSFYIPNAEFDPGLAPAISGTQAIRKFLLQGQSSGAIVGKRHVATNIIMSRDGDRITAQYYLSVLERENTPALVATALITDEFVNINGAWRIARHVTRVDPGFAKGGNAK